MLVHLLFLIVPIVIIGLPVFMMMTTNSMSSIAKSMLFVIGIGSSILVGYLTAFGSVFSENKIHTEQVKQFVPAVEADYVKKVNTGIDIAKSAGEAIFSVPTIEK